MTKEKLLKIDNIMYRVKDLPRAEKFYTNALGLKKIWEDKKAKMIGFVLEDSDSEVVIHASADIPQFDYSYLVRDVLKFCNKYKKLGHKLILKPIDVRSGKYAILADLDGNEIPIIDLTKFSGRPRFD
jgi:catechol 2,3-dioxygenase-like lactoylglutathione lyase family enzyme